MTSETKTKQSYLTPEQLSERWVGAIGVRTLANWRTNGTGPAFTKVGGAVLYPVEKVLEYEQKNTVNSTSQYTGH